MSKNMASNNNHIYFCEISIDF